MNYRFPIAVPKPKPMPSSTSTHNYYEGNVPLMEARFLELSSSIRALYRSIQELREFIISDNDNDNNNDDDNDNSEFIQAINENVVILQKQRSELFEIVERMNILNAHTDVPDDIRIMVVEAVAVGEEKAATTTTATTTTMAMTMATLTMDANTNNNPNGRRSSERGDSGEEKDDNDDDNNAGFYL